MVVDEARSATRMRWARTAGLLLSAGSCAYLAYLGWQSITGAGAAPIALPSALDFAAATVAATLAMALLAFAWHWALCAAGGTSMPRGAAIAYALSQPAKYLPGNVLHFASRHALGRGEGHRHATLVAATLLEALSLVGVALVIAAIWRLPAMRNEVLAFAGRHWLSTSIALLTLAACAWAALARYRRISISLPHLALHALCALGYFLLTAGAFWRLAPEPLQALAIGPVLSAVALSWVGGFVVVGAPGGIGVREALLLQLLAGSAPTAALLATALAFRVSMVAADFALFGLAFVYSRRPAAP